MLEELLKDKKKLGIYIIIGILLIILGVTYYKNGYTELRKNNDEDIFVEQNEEINIETEKNNIYNLDESNIELKDKSIVVEIKGEVNSPDVYILKDESIVKDVIDLAGGVTEEADLSNINRAKKLQNHELIYIRNKNEVSEENIINVFGNAIDGVSDNSNLINLNSATIEDLKSLNGIGDAKAAGIVEYREKNGGFSSIDQIKEVDGIGEKMFEKIKDKIEI
ncbi:MAG: ComEA family DNA-binding protein [Clostridium butyricum]|nr:ComEA family DNA-binding protein [Clostridium butyricum]